MLDWSKINKKKERLPLLSSKYVDVKVIKSAIEKRMNQ